MLPRKQEGNFRKIGEKLRNLGKSIVLRLRKLLGKFTLNLGKVGRKYGEFQNKF